jgi:hypothetical protein
MIAIKWKADLRFFFRRERAAQLAKNVRNNRQTLCPHASLRRRFAEANWQWLSVHVGWMIGVLRHLKIQGPIVLDSVTSDNVPGGIPAAGNRAFYLEILSTELFEERRVKSCHKLRGMWPIMSPLRPPAAVVEPAKPPPLPNRYFPAARPAKASRIRTLSKG